MDAMLGAFEFRGDIDFIFPQQIRRAGADSLMLLAASANSGARLQGNIDSVVRQSPKLKPHIQMMWMRSPVLQVKPRTKLASKHNNEKLGPVGRHCSLCKLSCCL